LIDSDKLQALVVEALDDGKAKDIKVIDVRQFTDIADYMVIASGTSDRHCKSLADRASDKSSSTLCNRASAISITSRSSGT
jgi:ribosome-associated protein